MIGERFADWIVNGLIMVILAYVTIGSIFPEVTTLLLGAISVVIVYCCRDLVFESLENLTVTAMFLLTIYLAPMVIMFSINDFFGGNSYGLIRIMLNISTVTIGRFGILMITMYNIVDKYFES